MLPMMLVLAAANVAIREPETEILGTGGDNPPLEALSLVGHLEFETAVASYDYHPHEPFPFSFNVSLPDSASVAAAYFFTEQRSWSGDASWIWVDFPGFGREVLEPRTFDLADSTSWINSVGYGANVTPWISGSGWYTALVWRCGDCWAPDACWLTVIYEDPALPLRQVNLLFGNEMLQHGTSEAVTGPLPGGQATVRLQTRWDESASSSGVESIAVNGEVIACCSVFDGSSLFEFTATTVPGANTVAATTGEDWIMWYLLGVISELGPTSVEPLSWGKLKQLYR